MPDELRAFTDAELLRAKKRTTRELINDLHMVAAPGEYGLGSEPDSLVDDPKKAWIRIGMIAEVLMHKHLPGDEKAERLRNARVVEGMQIGEQPLPREHKDYEEEINGLATEVEEFISLSDDHPCASMMAIGSRIHAIVCDMLDLDIADANTSALYYATSHLVEHRILSLVMYRGFRPAKPM